MSRGQFRDTPYNRDCPHNKLVFRSYVGHCPYCFEPSVRLMAIRLKQTLSTLSLLGVLAWLVWLTWRK